MSDNPLVVALLKEFKDEALLTRTEAGQVMKLTRGQVAGICNRNGIVGWPSIPKEVHRKRCCCFPLGQPGEADFHLCGKPRITAHPFLCDEHEERVWVPNGKVLHLK